MERHDQDSDSDSAAPVHRQARCRRDRRRDDRRAAAEPDHEVRRPEAALYAADGKLRSFVNIYVNDDDIRYLQKDQTPVKAGDTVSIIPSVAGGAPSTGVKEPATLPELSGDEIKRYSRHLIMPEVGMEGQRKLKAAKVLCIGAGGLGSPAAMYLAAAGVGTHRHRRFRRRRLQQPAAADHSRHARRRPRRSSRRRRIA